jgi:hypothetical protein
MHASPGREVQAIFLHGREFALLLTADAQEAGSQELGNLVEALGGGHQIGVESIAAPAEGGWPRGSVHDTSNAPLFIRKCRDLRRFLGTALARVDRCPGRNICRQVP